MYANGKTDKPNHLFWGQKSIYSGSGLLDVDSNNNIVDIKSENFTVKRDAFAFDIYVFNFNKYCFEKYNNTCYGLVQQDNRHMDVSAPVISIFDGGGGDGSNAHWITPDVTFPYGTSSMNLTWHVLHYDKAKHTFTILNEFSHYPPSDDFDI